MVFSLKAAGSLREFVARMTGLKHALSKGTYAISPCRNITPLLEQLEPRVMLSGTTYVVNTLVDTVAADGVLSLREAIQAANTNALVNEAAAGSADESDIITFDESLSGGTITLNGTQLEITDNLEIQGLGRDLLTIDAHSKSRIFGIKNFEAGYGYHTVYMTISNLSLTGGNADFGGAISAYTPCLTINNCYILNNHATVNGGGIYVSTGGTANISESMISFNNAENSGGGVFDDNRHYTTRWNIENSVINGNSATYNGGGVCTYGNFYINHSIVTNNTATIGGGIYNGFRFIATNSNISGNLAETGGGIYSYHLIITRNSTIAGNFANITGGGIYNEKKYDALFVYNSVIAINHNENGYDDVFSKGKNDVFANSFIGSRDGDPGFLLNPSAGSDGIWGTVDDVAGDYHLADNSLLKNAGSNALAVDEIFRRALVTDLDGNNRIMGSAVDIGTYECIVNQQLIEITAASKWTYTFTDPDGDNVTVKISGMDKNDLEAKAILYFDVNSIADNLTYYLMGIEIVHSTSKTTLSFAVTPDKVKGGTGYTVIGGISVDGLISSISGGNVDIYNGQILLNTRKQQVGEKDCVSINLGAFTNVGVNTNRLPVKSLTIDGWVDTDDVSDVLATLRIDKLKVTGRKDNQRTLEINEYVSGDFNADITCSGMDKRGVAIGSIESRFMFNSAITAEYVDGVQGSIDNITVGDLAGSIFASYIKNIKCIITNNVDNPSGGYLNSALSISGLETKKGYIALGSISAYYMQNSWEVNGTIGKMAALTAISLNLNACSFDSRGYSIGSISAGQTLYAYNWVIDGGIKSITAARFVTGMTEETDFHAKFIDKIALKKLSQPYWYTYQMKTHMLIGGDMQGVFNLGCNSKGVSLGNLYAQREINASINIQPDTIAKKSGGEIEVVGIIQRITAGQWSSGTITAGGITSIEVKGYKGRWLLGTLDGNFYAHLKLDSATYNTYFKPLRNALGKIKVVGQIQDSYPDPLDIITDSGYDIGGDGMIMDII